MTSVRLLKSVKNDSGWHKPGAIVDLDSKEAADLIKRKAAVSMDSVENSTSIPVKDHEAIEALIEINGVDDVLAEELIKIGLDSVAKVFSASLEVLTQIRGIGDASAKKIVISAQEILGSKVPASLNDVKGVDDGLAQGLIEDGVTTVRLLSELEVKTLMEFEGMTEELANEILESAKSLSSDK